MILGGTEEEEEETMIGGTMTVVMAIVETNGMGLGVVFESE